jgi:tRNA nucleotidyltransferase/poly(A) polymerase
VQGGAVRDVLASRQPDIKDMDMSYGCSPNEFSELAQAQVRRAANEAHSALARCAS